MLKTDSCDRKCFGEVCGLLTGQNAVPDSCAQGCSRRRLHKRSTYCEDRADRYFGAKLTRPLDSLSTSLQLRSACCSQQVGMLVRKDKERCLSSYKIFCRSGTPACRGLSLCQDKSVKAHFAFAFVSVLEFLPANICRYCSIGGEPQVVAINLVKIWRLLCLSM